MTVAERFFAKVGDLLETMFWIYAGYFALAAIVSLVVILVALRRDVRPGPPLTEEELEDFEMAYREWLSRRR